MNNLGTKYKELLVTRADKGHITVVMGIQG